MDTVSAQRWTLAGAVVACTGLDVAQVLAADVWPARVTWPLQALMAAGMGVSFAALVM